MFEEGITVEALVRPLLVATLVRDSDEFSAAVRLASHVWAGHLHPILPSPRSGRQEEELRRALYRLDPDVVFAIDRDFGLRERRVMGATGRLSAGLDSGRIESHATGADPLRIRHGVLPHAFVALAANHPDGLPNSTIRFVLGSRAPEHALFGSICTEYENYLTSSFQAQELKAPATAREWVESSAIGTSFRYPPDVATMGCSVQQSFQLMTPRTASRLEDPLVTSPLVAVLYAPNGDQDLETLAAFWNSRARSTPRSLLVPLAKLEADLDGVFEALWSIASPRQVIIVSSLERDRAQQLMDAARTALIDLGREANVAVVREGMGYAAARAHGRAQLIRSMRLERGPSGRFAMNLDTPTGFPRRDLLFGATLKITSSRGLKLRLPDTPAVARSLTNSAVALERARSHPHGALWLRSFEHVRATEDGVAGIAKPGTEFEFFLSDEHVLVEEGLIAAGFEITTHRHNRYARGFMRRCGGLDAALRLVRLGAMDVLAALVFDKSQQPGMTWQQIVGRLTQRRGLDREAALAQLEELLPPLLEAGIVMRGVGLRCPHCDLSDWYSVADLAEHVRCAGCSDDIQLYGNEARYRFRPNELARRFLSEGGRAVLECARTLKQIEPSIALAFGGDVVTPTGAHAEIDLIALTPAGLLLAECKSLYSPSTADLDQVEVSTRKLVDRAIEARLDEALLCVACGAREDEVLLRSRSLAAEAEARGVQLDLILNETFYLRSQDLVEELHQVSYPAEPTILERPAALVGDVLGTFGFGAGRILLDQAVLSAWERQRRVAGSTDTDK